MLTCKHAPSWLAQRCHTDHFSQCSALLSLIMSRAFSSVMHRFKIEKVKPKTRSSHCRFGRVTNQTALRCKHEQWEDIYSFPTNIADVNVPVAGLYKSLGFGFLLDVSWQHDSHFACVNSLLSVVKRSPLIHNTRGGNCAGGAVFTMSVAWTISIAAPSPHSNLFICIQHPQFWCSVAGKYVTCSFVPVFILYRCGAARQAQTEVFEQGAELKKGQERGKEAVGYPGSS